MSVLTDLLVADKSAFARLNLAARKVCSQYMHQPSDVDGASQDAWEIALRHGDELRDPKAAVAWFGRIAQRVCFERLDLDKKRQAALHTLEVDETVRGVLTGLGHTLTPVLDQELEDDIHSLITQLPPDERMIMLRRLAGRTWAQVGADVGMTEWAAKKAGERIRRKLVSQLKALRERYAAREEPLPENRPPAMYIDTLADVERLVTGLPAADQAEILEQARKTLPRRRNYEG